MEVADLGGQEQFSLHLLRVYRGQVNTSLDIWWSSGGKSKATI